MSWVIELDGVRKWFERKIPILVFTSVKILTQIPDTYEKRRYHFIAHYQQTELA